MLSFVSFGHRDKHGGLFSILLVGRPVSSGQIFFFELDGNQDVASCRESEYKMPQRHLRRCPKCNHKAQVDRVTNELIEHGRLEADGGVLVSFGIKSNLAETKKIKVTDHECAGQHDQPAEVIQPLQKIHTHKILYVPDGFIHWIPEPVHQIETKAGE